MIDEPVAYKRIKERKEFKMMLISGIILTGGKLDRRTSWVGMKFYGVKIWSNGVLDHGSTALIRLLPTPNRV